MEQTLFEKFDKIVCPINIAKTPTDLENLSGLIIRFLRIKSSKVIYDSSGKNITLCVLGIFFAFFTALLYKDNNLCYYLGIIQNYSGGEPL